MAAKIHTLGSCAADRYKFHRAALRYNRENLGPDQRYPQDRLKAAQGQDQSHTMGGAVVRSERMKAVFRLVEKTARSNATVLIGGESGTGKDVVARALHELSLRCERPWVDINCGALPGHLVESELALARGGTLFLDEIGELDARMQVKLLRVLDGVPHCRLGSARKVAVDARIVAATNKNLEQAVEAGTFRGDLFHRLNQVRIQVPPLRERVEDIAPLAYRFLHELDPRLDLGDDALEALEDYWWPGNVRELRNVVTRAAVLAEGWEICAADLNLKLSAPGPAENPELKRYVGGLEEQVIREVLEESGGRQDVGLLGISRRTLLGRLKEYKMPANTGVCVSPVLSI